jgi:uncharacterized protein (DUF1015 family)
VFDAAVVGPLEGVTAPPYDVISRAGRLEYLRASPFSVVHVDLAEGTEDPADPENRYARAAHLLADWERRGAVRRAAAPTYYVYEMSPVADVAAASRAPSAGGRSISTVRGLICAMTLEDWGGSVLPHEHVLQGPVQDRLALLRATRTHLSPVYGTIDGPDGVLESFLRSVADAPTPFEVVDEQGILHRMWPAPGDPEVFDHLVREHLLIADGHHRYTTALRYRDECLEAEGNGPWNSVLTLIVDAAAQHLPVLPFHRLQLAGDPPPAVGDVVDDLDAALAALSDDEVTVGTVCPRSDGGATYRVRRLAGDPPTVRALHRELLDPQATRGSIRYLPDAADVVAGVAGGAVAGYLLPPTTPERIRRVVEEGERLPQKSTYFWPKPRTGMVMMPLDRDRARPRAAEAGRSR